MPRSLAAPKLPSMRPWHCRSASSMARRLAASSEPVAGAGIGWTPSAVATSRRWPPPRIVARSMTVPLALQAAELIQSEFDVSVEVIDPRTIKPLDIDTIVNSVKKTNRLVIAEESHSFAGVAAEITYQVMDTAFDYLDAPIERVGSTFTPVGFHRALERAILPDVKRVLDAARKVLSY